MALRPGLFGAGFNPLTPTKIRTVDLVEQMCLRCSKRIITDLLVCVKELNMKCGYCSGPTINKPCLEVPSMFIPRVNNLIRLRDVILQEGRVATRAEVQQQKDYTKAVEAYGKEAQKVGISAMPTKQPSSTNDYLNLMLHEQRVQSTVAQEAVIATLDANDLKQETNQTLADLTAAVTALNSAYRQAHNLPAVDAPPAGPAGGGDAPGAGGQQANNALAVRNNAGNNPGPAANLPPARPQQEDEIMTDSDESDDWGGFE